MISVALSGRAALGRRVVRVPSRPSTGSNHLSGVEKLKTSVEALDAS
jgi:hypothetical protein